METLTAAETREVLDGIAGTTLATLRKTGVLEGEKIGREVRYPKEAAEALASARTAPNTPALIVRLGEPSWSEEEDRPLGWGSSEIRTEMQNADAARRWWRIANPESYVGQPLVATVAEWVVGAWLITGGRQHYGLSEFFIEADPVIRAEWIGSRVPLKRGPVVLRWPRPN